MTSLELSDSQVFYAKELFSEEREDLRIGILCSLTDACHRAKGNPLPPAHYMPIRDKTTTPQPKQTEEEMKAEFRKGMAGFAKFQARKKK